jgi:arsenate reductase-like glutaredoxin family protein
MNNLDNDIKIYEHLPVNTKEAFTRSHKLLLDDELERVMQMANSVSVKAMVRELHEWNVNDSTIEILEQSFQSEILANLLSQVQISFAVLVSCQAPLEKPFDDDDLLNYLWDQVLEQMLQQGVKILRKEIDSIQKYPYLNLMSPGTGEAWVWPIEQQKQLFKILKYSHRIGVKLNDYGLMIPRKTLSGLFIPGDRAFIACDYCYREQCPSRRKRDNCIISHY